MRSGFIRFTCQHCGATADLTTNESTKIVRVATLHTPEGWDVVVGTDGELKDLCPTCLEAYNTKNAEWDDWRDDFLSESVED